MMGLSLIISLITNFSGVFPDGVLTASVRSNLTILLLAFMMTLSLSRIPTKDLSPKGNCRSLFRAVLLGLIIASIIPIIGYLLLESNPEYSKYAAGWVFIAATPFAASVAPLSFILRGDMEHALRATIYIYIISLAWIPFVVYMLLGEVVDMKNVIITVIEIIGIPLILSRFLTRFKIDKVIMGIVLNCIIFVLVWMSVSSTNFSGLAVSVFLVFVVIAVMRTFVLGNAVEIVERKMGVSWSQRVSDILIGSYKNKGIAIAMCVAIMGPNTPFAMVAITASIIVEVCWVIFMDSVLFNRKRMERELARDKNLKIKESWE